MIIADPQLLCSRPEFNLSGVVKPYRNDSISIYISTDRISRTRQPCIRINTNYDSRECGRITGRANILCTKR